MDCEKLSPKAFQIFKQLEPFFPPNPWNKPQWKEEGIVFDNGEFDLRKSADRKRLEENRLNAVGYSVKIQAKIIMDKEGSLDGIENHHFGKSLRSYLECLLILDDLDFQIETGDLVD